MQNDLRRKLIRETLDEDKHINKWVAQIQIKNIPKEDALLLKSQLNSDEIQKLNVYASSIRKILEHKANRSKLLLSYSTNQDTLNKYVVDISSIEELVSMYNYSVSIYRGLGLSQTSRLAMNSIFVTFEFYIDSIVKNLKMALPKVSDNWNIQSFRNAINFYEIIDNQLKKGNTSR